MKRRLLIILVGLSLLLAAFALVAGTRSMFIGYDVWFDLRVGDSDILTADGRGVLMFELTRYPTDAPARQSQFAWETPAIAYHSDRGSGYAEYRLEVPYWSLLVVGLVLPAWVGVRRGRSFLRERNQRRRARHGRCRACGYDLRGGGERCPECGTVAAEVSR